MIAMAMSNSSRSPNPPSFLLFIGYALPQGAPLGLGHEPLRVRYSNLPCRSIRWPWAKKDNLCSEPSPAGIASNSCCANQAGWIYLFAEVLRLYSSTGSHWF